MKPIKERTPIRLNYYKNLGRKIAYYRKYRNITQQALANRIGVSRTYISYIETSKKNVNPSLNTLFDIAEILDIPVIELFDSELT